MINKTVFRIRLSQLLLKFRILFHKFHIAFYNVGVTRLKRKCERLNLVNNVHVPPVFHTRLKVFGKIDDVFKGAHFGSPVSLPNDKALRR